MDFKVIETEPSIKIPAFAEKGGLIWINSERIPSPQMFKCNAICVGSGR